MDRPPAPVVAEPPPSIHRIGASLKWLVGKAAGAVVGFVFMTAATYTLSSVGGWATALRVGAVTIVPLLLMLQIGPRITTGFSAASPMAQWLRVKVAVLVVFALLFLPALFTWTGNPAACYHAIYGGGAGLVVAFAGFVAFMRVDRRAAEWIMNSRRGWRFHYRATASLCVALGVLVGLALS
ncbi:hypothetical protein [Lentzea sp. NPDC004782]|uniref:hypothetical protein n=1 Tax=Lentzea sp. NPDC004782 TaxID=3154458 RepID=UPI0033A7CE20